MRACPEISVVMPVYNALPYLESAVNSVLRQTMGDFEFLIYDDGSTDGSLDILNRVSAFDARIVLHTGPHRGLSHLLNEGLHSCRGKYMARMDADDICHPNRLAIQHQYLSANPRCLAVGSQALLIDPDGDPIALYDVPLSHDEIDQSHLRGKGGQLPHPTMMARTDAIRQIGGYDSNLEPAEDLDLLLRLAEVGHLANVSDRLLQYRLHAKQVSLSRRDQQLAAMMRSVSAAWCRRGRGTPPPDLVGVATSFDPWLQQLSWANQAIMAGYSATARKHAIKAVRERPASRTAWRAIIKAFLWPCFVRVGRS